MLTPCGLLFMVCEHVNMTVALVHISCTVLSVSDQLHQHLSLASSHFLFSIAQYMQTVLTSQQGWLTLSACRVLSQAFYHVTSVSCLTQVYQSGL